MLSLYPAQQCDAIASAFVTCVFSLNARQEQMFLVMFFEDYGLLGCDTVWSGRKVPTFCRILLPLSSG